MQYIKLNTDNGVVYQVIQDGYVIEYRDEDGALIGESLPLGIESSVADANPPRLDWMV